MALGPQNVQIQPIVAAVAKPTMPGDIKVQADAFEENLDAWLARPKGSPPPYAFHVTEPEVLDELVRRYVAAGWTGARVKGTFLVLDKVADQALPVKSTAPTKG